MTHGFPAALGSGVEGRGTVVGPGVIYHAFDFVKVRFN